MAFVGVRWKPEDEELLGKEGNAINGRSLGGMAKILLPSASVEISVLFGREIEDGRWGIIRGRGENIPKWKKLGWNGKYSFIRPPAASVGARGRPRRVWKEDGRWGIMGNY